MCIDTADLRSQLDACGFCASMHLVEQDCFGAQKKEIMRKSYSLIWRHLLLMRRTKNSVVARTLKGRMD